METKDISDRFRNAIRFLSPGSDVIKHSDFLKNYGESNDVVIYLEKSPGEKDSVFLISSDLVWKMGLGLCEFPYKVMTEQKVKKFLGPDYVPPPPL